MVGGAGTLSFSKHILAHALTGDAAENPVAGPAPISSGREGKRLAAQRCTAQMRIEFSDSGLTPNPKFTNPNQESSLVVVRVAV